jgi:hypothetical protein
MGLCYNFGDFFLSSFLPFVNLCNFVASQYEIRAEPLGGKKVRV